jgi:hypothetical protein
LIWLQYAGHAGRLAGRLRSALPFIRIAARRAAQP